MAFTPSPTPPNSGDPANFNSRADAILGWLPTFVAELNDAGYPDMPSRALVQGTAAAPTWTWDADPNTGVYRPGNDQWAVSTGGIQRLLITTSALSLSVAILAQGGSAGAPSYSAVGDTNTGLFFPAADTIGFATGGVERMRLTSNGLLTGGVVMQDNADTTPGRLMKVGSFGWGVISAGSDDALFGADCNNITTPGVWRVSGAAANRPVGTSQYTIFASRDGVTGRCHQMAFRGSLNEVYIRSYTGTTWQPWVRMQTGDQGWPAAINLTAADNLDHITVSGNYYNGIAANTPDNNYPAASAGSLLHQGDASPNRGTQMFVAYGTGAIYVRSRGASAVWSPWIRLDSERGSNGNGEYVRFGDGTMICTRRVNLGSILAEGAGTWESPYRTASIAASFAASFIAPPRLSLAFPVTGGLNLPDRVLVPAGFDVSNSGVTSLRVARIGGTNAPSDVTCDVTAIGRWF